MEIKFTDNSIEILTELQKAKGMALEAIGMRAETYAKKELTNFPAVDTGRLRNSITHATVADEGKQYTYTSKKGKEKTEHTDTVGSGAEKDAVYIGTNVEYAKWVELGTGIYASDGQGKKEPWVYQDDEGEYHLTQGIRPVHYLKKAATEHSDEYRQITERFCKRT